MEKPELLEKAKEIAKCFKNLVEEVNTLKLAFETILVMRSGIRYYPGCKSLDDGFEVSETLVKQRIAEIEASLNALSQEAKTMTAFIKESPLGGIQ
jgi:hypothetical protein